MFNDPIAAKRFDEFQRDYRFNTVFETGTDRGHGALHLAKYRSNIVTIENNPERRVEAMKFWCENGFRNNNGRVYRRPSVCWFDGNVFEFITDGGLIHSFLGSSPMVMAALLACGRFEGPFLFYLDAHGGDYWPLRDELKVVAGLWLADSCIIIHDCQVPGKPFGFDSYNGQALNYDYVAADLAAINPHFKVFYNEEADPGLRGRGILYAVPHSG